jgi:hypothetical protein
MKQKQAFNAKKNNIRLHTSNQKKRSENNGCNKDQTLTTFCYNHCDTSFTARSGACCFTEANRQTELLQRAPFSPTNTVVLTKHVADP